MATAKVEAAKKVLAKAEELFRKQFSNRALKNRKELKEEENYFYLNLQFLKEDLEKKLNM